MSQALDKLEANVYELVKKYDLIATENKKLQQENQYLKEKQIITEKQHQAAVDELGEALVGQINKLKTELQSKIDQLTTENQTYRTLLNESAAEIRTMLARLPQDVPSYHTTEEQA